MRRLETLLNYDAGSASYLCIAAAFLMLAMYLGAVGWGTYSVVGALLLVPAVGFSAYGIRAILGQPEHRAQSAHTRALLAVLCLAMLAHGYISFRVLQNIKGEVIDVYTFQHDATAALVRGTNPYTITQRDIYGQGSSLYPKDAVVNGRVQVGLPYPPASLFFVLPGYLLGDLRYAYVAGVLLSAALLAAARVSGATIGVACVLLLNPITFWVEARGWTEPFVLLGLTLTVYASLKRRAWLPLALGLCLASKQYSVLAIPFTPFLIGDFRWRPYRRMLLQSLGVGALLTLPFALWNFHSFWHDIVQFEIAQPFRSDSLSLGVLFPILRSLVPLGVVIAIPWAFKRAKPHPAMFAACFGFTFLVFVCANKQAFCNYYFLIVQTLLLAAATLDIPMAPEPASAEPVVSRSMAGLESSVEASDADVPVVLDAPK